MKAINFERSEKYEKNIERYGDSSETCFCCGRPTATNLWLHYTEHGFLVNVASDPLPSNAHGKSQGFFPVGSECAKKYPKDFIFTARDFR